MNKDLYRRLYDSVKQATEIMDKTKKAIIEVVERHVEEINISSYTVSIGFKQRLDPDDLVVELAYNQKSYNRMDVKKLGDFLDDLYEHGLINNYDEDALTIGEPFFNYDMNYRYSFLWKITVPDGAEEDTPETEDGDAVDGFDPENTTVSEGNDTSENDTAPFRPADDKQEPDAEQIPTQQTVLHTLDEVTKEKIRKNVREIIRKKKDYIIITEGWNLILKTDGKRYQTDIPEGKWRECYREVVNTKEEENLLLDMAEHFFVDKVTEDYCLWLAGIAAEEEPENNKDSLVDEQYYEEEPETVIVSIMDTLPENARYDCENYYNSRWNGEWTEEEKLKIREHISNAFVFKMESLYSYYIGCTIDGTKVYALMMQSDVQDFLERDTSGSFTRRVDAEQIAARYFHDKISEYTTTTDGIVTVLGNMAIFKIGKGPAFEPDPLFCLDGMTKNPLFGKTRIVKYLGAYYIDTYINKIHRTAQLTNEDVRKITETDGSGNPVSSISPFNLIFNYFGHEIEWEDKGIHLETEEDLFRRSGKEEQYSCCKTLCYCGEPRNMMPEKEYHLKDRKLPKGYTVRVTDVSKDDYNTYRINYTINGGIFRGRTYRMSVLPTPDVIQKMTERNEEGRYTRKLTLQAVAEYYATAVILRMTGLLMAVRRDIPVFVIMDRFLMDEYEIKDFEKTWNVKVSRRRSVKLTTAQKADMKKDFADGMTVERLKEKYGLDGYNAVYCTIEKMKGRPETLPLPQRIEKLLKLL